MDVVFPGDLRLSDTLTRTPNALIASGPQSSSPAFRYVQVLMVPFYIFPTLSALHRIRNLSIHTERHSLSWIEAGCQNTRKSEYILEAQKLPPHLPMGLSTHPTMSKMSHVQLININLQSMKINPQGMKMPIPRHCFHWCSRI
jgi:hypothetical protein